jgi:arginine decarboxylase
LKTFFFAVGTGYGGTELNAFDGALLNAGVGNVNIMRMSSIVPPGAVYHPEACGIDILEPGSLVPMAYAAITRPAFTYAMQSLAPVSLSAIVGVGLPKDPKLPGVIMEHSEYFSYQTEDQTIRTKMKTQIEQMVQEGMEMRDTDYWFLYRPAAIIRLGGSVKANAAAAFAAVVLA